MQVLQKADGLQLQLRIVDAAGQRHLSFVQAEGQHSPQPSLVSVKLPDAADCYKVFLHGCRELHWNPVDIRDPASSGIWLSRIESCKRLITSVKIACRVPEWCQFWRL